MKNKNGFALLLVLSVIALTTIVIINIWFVASLQHDIITQRELWYKKTYATETILNTGLVLACQHYDQLLSVTRDTIIDLSYVLDQTGVTSLFNQAQVMIKKTPDNKFLIVTALCITKDRLSYQMRCVLKKVIRNKQEVMFVVRAFTLSNSV